jgi:hypothetical protein
MAYYTALTSAWAAGTVPGGYVGTALTGLTTANKLIAINGWTITGAIPTNFYVTGNQLLNCINWTEFAALTAAQQSNLLALCNVQGTLLGGSTNAGVIIDGMFLAYFTNTSGATRTALTALAQGAVTTWWQNNSYGGPIGANDLIAAGGLT